ncbi:hypothetical protein WG908_08040 [Sphingobium sp. AN641]|uniref:hypothetical protein n=1 Tax=Sphingobium sp. AN641 TaxID=3133443 RepID=UPI0030BF7BC9
MAERRAVTVLGAQQLGEAAYQTQSAEAKRIAADAVAANEAEVLRADSQKYNRLASAGDRAAIETGKVTGFELDNESANPTPAAPRPL